MRRTFRAGVLATGAIGLAVILLLIWGVTMAKKQEAESKNHKAEARKAFDKQDFAEAAMHLGLWCEKEGESVTKDPDYGALAHGIADAQGNRQVRHDAGYLMQRAILAKKE